MSKLTSQIRNRQKYAEYQNEKNLAYENSQIDQCLKSIDQLNLQQQNDRLRAKKHWEMELARTQNWNNIRA